MKTRTMIILVIILLALLWGISLIKKPTINLPNKTSVVMSYKNYTNNKYGISFQYPDNYILTETETEAGTTERIHHNILLVDKSFVAGNATEGPTSINIDIYQNNQDKLTTNAWIKNTSESNFKLSNGILNSAQIASTSAISYGWDGLYRGKTTVFEYNQNIFAVSGTYLETSDPIVKDYENLLNSIQLIYPPTQEKLPQTPIENYLKENISKLSPEKEVLGGKFYITKVTLDYGDKGVVSYEDGHNSYRASFNYGIDKTGNIFITDFSVIK